MTTAGQHGPGTPCYEDGGVTAIRISILGDMSDPQPEGFVELFLKELTSASY